jgi:hypothetical protein
MWSIIVEDSSLMLREFLSLREDFPLFRETVAPLKRQKLLAYPHIVTFQYT